ncbi:MAG: BolA/IbaG family iron-sulfur metabolism protein [Pseudomonadota bacterium]
MPLESHVIQQMIEENIPGAKVEIQDLRGDGDHYTAHIVSKSFEGKTKIQQHQMVYKALQGKMGNELHALSIHTKIEE